MFKFPRTLLPRLFALLLFMFAFPNLNAQEFVKQNPFETNYFIQNHGQFRGLNCQNGDSIYFALDNGQDLYYFLKDGFIVKFSHLTLNNEKLKWIESIKQHFKNKEEWKEEAFERSKIEYSCIRVKWIGTNALIVPKGELKSEHYFTYGDPVYNSYGFEKLIYTNFYNGADLVFDIPAHGGIHYQFNCSKGFDYKQIEWIYQSQCKLQITSKNELIVNSKGDTLLETGLQVHQNSMKIPSKYLIKANGNIGFDIGLNLNSSQNYIIDPFVTQITTLRSGGPGGSKALDVDYDYVGNAFVFGGGSANFTAPQNQKIAKYSPGGAHKWTFMGMVPSVNWESKGSNGSPGNFIVDKISGKVYCGQGFENVIGTRIIRIDSNGIYNNYVSMANSNFCELWDMAINCRNKSVFGMGGSTYSNQNSGSLDTLGNFTAVNFTGVPTGAYPNGYSQDVVSCVMDDNRNLFAIVASGPTLAVDNHLYRLNSSYNGSVWNVPTGWSSLAESNNKPYVASFASNGFNAIDVNDSYVFYYDGQNLAAYDKSSGAFVSAGVSMPGYTLKRQGGIASEHCNRVYIGGNNGAVNVLSFNGSNFVSLPDITLAGVLGRKIYDVKLNRSTKLLYICGDSFVAVKSIPYNCNLGGVQLQTTMQCPNLGICNILNYDSTSNYMFIWRDSTTHTTLKFLKNAHKAIDTVLGVQPNHLYAVTVYANISCGGPSRTVAFSGSVFYASQSFTVCAGQGISFGTHYYTNPGIYTDTIYQGSCVTVWSTKLTVRPKYNITRTYAICSGNAVHIGSHFYYTTGNYHDTLISFYGCDSIIHSNVIVGNSSSFTQNISGCNGSPIIVGNKTYYVNGTFVDTLFNYVYCDSVVTTHLNFYPKSSYSQNLSTCFNHPVFVGPYQHSTAGIYVDHLSNRFGCDSAVTTYLAVVPYKSHGQTFTICQGSSVTVGSHTYSNLGYYYDTLASYSGCDSIVTTVISWNPIQYANQIVNTCSNHPLQVGNNIHINSGFYIDTLVASTGCDSIVFSLLTVSPSQTITHNYHSCSPISINVGSHTYNASGIYRDTFVNKFACDSIIVTNLVIGVPKSVSQLKYLCNGPVSVGSHLYTVPGTYHDTLQTYLLCDSVVNTIVLAGSNTSFINNASICIGSSIVVGTHTYNATGTYHDTIFNHYGCDSFITTNLQVKNKSAKTQTLNVCYNHPLVVGTHSYNVSGVYHDTLMNYLGCDSILTSILTVRPVSVKNQTFNLCFGQSIQVGIHQYSSGGIFKDTLVNYRGCDSIITSTIFIKPRNLINKTVHICAGDFYTVGAHSYTQSGSYHDTLINKYNCDSIINTTLIVHSTQQKNQTVSICQGQSYSIGNNNYVLAGNYLDTLISYVGCDSIISTVLTVKNNSSFIQNIVICNGQTVVVGAAVHSTTGTFIDHLNNYVGCDSAVTTILKIKPRSFKNQSFQFCAGDSIVIGSHIYKQTGTYLDTFINYLACDSIVTTNILVHPIKHTYLNGSICKGDVFYFGNSTLSQTGSYLDTLSGYLGCDSIVALNLVVNLPDTLYQSLQICNGDVINVNGHSYSTSGNYVDTASNIWGCDSLIYTNLFVAERYNSTQTYNLCVGDSLLVGQHTYHISGLYHDTLTSQYFCDSIINTQLNLLSAGVDIIADPDTLFFTGDKIDLSAITLNSSDSILKWLPSNLVIGNGNSSYIIPTNSTVVWVYTINKAGCIAKDSLQLIKIDVDVPNAFTPNNDNQNDIFLLRGEGLSAVISYEIYNRWGERVFYTTDATQGWDGYYKGQLQPVANYTYQIKLQKENSSKVRTVKGSFLLLR